MFLIPYNVVKNCVFLLTILLQTAVETEAEIYVASKEKVFPNWREGTDVLLQI